MTFFIPVPKRSVIGNNGCDFELRCLCYVYDAKSLDNPTIDLPDADKSCNENSHRSCRCDRAACTKSISLNKHSCLDRGNSVAYPVAMFVLPVASRLL